MKKSYISLGFAIVAWISLGALIGFQSVQDTPPQMWSLVQRFALAGFALVATFLASKHTASS